MKHVLSIDEKRRANKVAFTGALLAAAMCLMITGLLDSGNPVNIFAPMGKVFVLPAALATYVSVRLCWRHMLRKRESRGRGARYGALAGLLAVFLMCAITMIASAVYGMFLNSAVQDGNFFNQIADLMIVTIGLFYYALIFGGVLAIPFGALAGFMLTQDPQHKAINKA